MPESAITIPTFLQKAGTVLALPSGLHGSYWSKQSLKFIAD